MALAAPPGPELTSYWQAATTSSSTSRRDSHGDSDSDSATRSLRPVRLAVLSGGCVCPCESRCAS
eukprot:2323382-Rhodomonas_salina.1